MKTKQEIRKEVTILLKEYRKLGFGKPFKTWYGTVDNSVYENNAVGITQFLAEKYYYIICVNDEESRLNAMHTALEFCKKKNYNNYARTKNKF